MEHGGPEGRVLSEPAFPDDDGSAPPALMSAVALAAAGGGVAALVAALAAGRVLVPVVATVDGTLVTPAGLTAEKSADMSVVTVRAPNGRLGLPVFTSTTALAEWHQGARPVPVAGRRAALAAYDEGADALLLDPAGPQPYVLDGPALRALAEGRPLLPAVEDPDVTSAVRTAAAQAGIPAEDVLLRAGTDTDLVVVVTVSDAVTGSDPDRLADRIQRFGELLAQHPVLRVRLGRGLDIEVLE